MISLELNLKSNGLVQIDLNYRHIIKVRQLPLVMYPMINRRIKIV